MIRSEKTPMISIKALEELGFTPEDLEGVHKFYMTQAGIPVEDDIAELIQDRFEDIGLQKVIEHHFGEREGRKFYARTRMYFTGTKNARAIGMFVGAFSLLWDLQTTPD